MFSLSLPDDLRAFLDAGKQLDCDLDSCDAGEFELLPVDKLVVELFPMYTDSHGMTELELNKDDPHLGENGYYLVEGVNLVGACSGGYPHCGLLMWWPLEGRYGMWDGDHWHISVSPAEITWTEIVADPGLYIDSGWGDLIQESPPLRPLVPWHKYRYSEQKGSGPFPYSERS